MARIQHFPAINIFLHLFAFSKLNLSTSKSSGFSLRLIPRDSPESPLYTANLTRLERIERLIGFTNAKLQPVKLQSDRNATFDDGKYLTALKRQDFYYIAQMYIGNPPQLVYLMVDTGAGLTWTQCQPCINCFHQEIPIYNSLSSSTYRRLPCEDPRCNYRDEVTIFQCVDGECVYDIYYSSGNIGPTRGVASSERFKFLTDTDLHYVEFDILFGCSDDNTNFAPFDEPGNRISGILGLSLSPESLSSQLGDLIGRTFSYCVVPFGANFPFNMHSHILSFGDDVDIPEGIPTTHYFTFAGENHYYLACTDISIGAYRLGLPSGTFDAAEGSGFFIDSGAAFTTLTTEAINGINVFENVISVFMLSYDSCGLVRVPDDDNVTPYQLCYWHRDDFSDYPSITFHFQGADYTVDGKFTIIYLEELGYFCVAINSSPGGASVLGSFYMQDMRIIHNGFINAIQFYSVSCANEYL